MIRNSRQASIARRKQKELHRAAAQADHDKRSGYLALAQDIADELNEYDSIRFGRVFSFGIDGIDELGDALTKARLARGWTQRELAANLGVTEQMVQKDEAHSYERAGLSRVAEVADILGYCLVGYLKPARAVLPSWCQMASSSGYSIGGISNSSLADQAALRNVWIHGVGASAIGAVAQIAVISVPASGYWLSQLNAHDPYAAACGQIQGFKDSSATMLVEQV